MNDVQKILKPYLDLLRKQHYPPCWFEPSVPTCTMSTPEFTRWATTSAQNGEVVMGIPTCLACKTPWGHTLDCPLVLGWRARAEKAEAEVVRLRYELDAALLHIRVLTGAGE